MSATQRRKGAAGERELARLLTEELGVDIWRNLEQVRSGGADLLGLACWSIEVKRQERLALPTWWRQACAEAGEYLPVLAYRQSRRPWRFRLPLEIVMDPSVERDWITRPHCELDFAGFCLLSREMIGALDDR